MRALWVALASMEFVACAGLIDAQHVQPPLQPVDKTPTQVLQEHSLPINTADTLPGGKGVHYLPEQDTAYVRALKLVLPPSVRFSLDVQRILSNFELVRRKSELESPWQAALRNMTLSGRVFQPDPREIVQRQVSIATATAMPVTRSMNIGTVSVPLSTIGSFLGVMEDVSPRMSYQVRQAARVQAVVYSTTALIVRRLLDQEQRPGVYEIEWDGQDDRGRILPAGDYVLEVRIGDETLLRKRVVLSGQ